MLREPWFRPVEDKEPFREPWFRILDVTEANGRSVADIVVEVAGRRNLKLPDIRGGRMTKPIVEARRDAIEQIRRERPDLSSGKVAAFLRMDGSSVRHQWLKMERSMHS